MTDTVSTARSEDLFAEAQGLMPGGVSSPVRAFKSVSGVPRFIERGEGPYLVDVDGNRYIDYVLSFGPLLLGHAPDAVTQAITEQAAKGTSYGAPSPLEVRLAHQIQDRYPSMERLRFVNSGTEGAMSAVRAARAFTGRNKVVKFDGHYHGHADLLLAKAGSGVATLGLPDSPGVPAAVTADTLVIPFNDEAAVREVFEREGSEIAALLVEPIAGNMGLVRPRDGYLQMLREVTETHGALLVFDEVMVGFRVHPGGAQALYDVTPDLTVLGKVIGGGLPVGAYGGRADVMKLVAPDGPVYQAGTLSGNPLAMAAGLALLGEVDATGAWEAAAEAARTTAEAVQSAADAAGVPVVTDAVGTMFGFFFNDRSLFSFEDVQTSDKAAFSRLHGLLLERRVYLPPSPFEACFTSSAHTPDVVETAAEAFQSAFAAL
ncbi:glutamate-1-semialdehyde 2,1-aminomutase [Rubrivirga sp. S365]|uniref:Glutamate-1-semialdehyde 2,1-aminomutase n=1 Tax=Rubrivirga litoralis TaxID=3075598 RepID=A0ABU3BTT2_9BACT|nr:MULTISPECIES: glutamate-1-semialdehyde 2,1-aminomutase [unclassified Rubrivirga]MDT0632700.1 glutamate-1-semialdehyde 2,1-aminomutase [Rubrivirga sp. F394]MDT7857834.1 glutamate-1-semialdehyde 2,1-aminomutase [Rubrivirga sp. S365]